MRYPSLGASKPVRCEKPYAARPLQRHATSYVLEQRESGRPDVVLVEVAGELDLTNARSVEERLEAIEVADGQALVLDLNRLVFIDSAALHVLFRTARRLGRAGFGIVLEPTAAVASTLSIVGMSEVAAVAGGTDELALQVMD